MNLGDIKIHPLSDGTFRLDGGAMFGVVPRTLWEKTNAPDEKNRILLGLNPVLIQAGETNILVETGIGTGGDEKFRSIFSIDRAVNLKDSLSGLGLKEADIDIVINTHLHFDHAGGNTIVDSSGVSRPAFPNAKYLVQKGEFENAKNPGERSRASYRDEDFLPVKEAGLFEFLDGDCDVADGVSVFRTSGHNENIQLVKVESGGHTAIFLSDIIPTTSHLKYPYIASYDLFPLQTLKVKKEIIKKAAEQRWLLFFYHDPVAKAGYVKIKEGKPLFEKVL